MNDPEYPVLQCCYNRFDDDRVRCINDVEDEDYGSWLVDNLKVTAFHGTEQWDGNEYAMCFWSSKTKGEQTRVEEDKFLEPWCLECHNTILIEKLRGGYLEND